MTARAGKGVFIAVVGPSGAGKDTVIAQAAAHFSGDLRVEFVRRVITRPCDGSTEVHDTMTDAAFAEADAGGAFALSWQAHGLRYGIPASVDTAIADGRIVIANASRGVLSALRRRYARVLVAEITARPEILAERLAARRRESRDEVLARLARAVPSDHTDGVSIDNSGDMAIAGRRFIAVIEEALGTASAAKEQ